MNQTESIQHGDSFDQEVESIHDLELDDLEPGDDDEDGDGQQESEGEGDGGVGEGDANENISVGTMLLPDDAPKPKVITVPAILHYTSKSHECERYYVDSIKGGKPNWTTEITEATVFHSIDHLKLAGRWCRSFMYRKLKVTPVPAQ